MDSLTFLGTGTSTGVPMIGCECSVCVSDDPMDTRLRSSAWILLGECSILIDTSTDLRTQALAAGMRRLDAVFFTHHHADHVHGIDELRSFNFIQKRPIPCYGNKESLERIRTMFAYIVDPGMADGGGKPDLSLIAINGPVKVGDGLVTPVPVMHGKIGVLGYRIKNTAYITDCSGIPPTSERLLTNLDTLVIGALGLKSHPTHFTIEQAIESIDRFKPKRAFLTHLNHSVGYKTASSGLPDGVELAWDGLRIEI